MTMMIQAYQFALDPTPVQESALRSHCGGQRYAYNWGLHQVQANLAQRAAERSYGLADAELTPALKWSAYSLRKDWNQVKAQVAPWWGENSKRGVRLRPGHLAAALGNWNDSKSSRRRGPEVRFPRFKGRRAGCPVGSLPARSA